MQMKSNPVDINGKFLSRERCHFKNLNLFAFMVDGLSPRLARVKGGGGRLLPTIAYAGSLHPKELQKERENSCFVIYSYL